MPEAISSLSPGFTSDENRGVLGEERTGDWRPAESNSWRVFSSHALGTLGAFMSWSKAPSSQSLEATTPKVKQQWVATKSIENYGRYKV